MVQFWKEVGGRNLEEAAQKQERIPAGIRDPTLSNLGYVRRIEFTIESIGHLLVRILFSTKFRASLKEIVK